MYLYPLTFCHFTSKKHECVLIGFSYAQCNTKLWCGRKIIHGFQLFLLGMHNIFASTTVLTEHITTVRLALAAL